MVLPFQFATCNELFKDMPFDSACAMLSRIGYAGLEIAPFTLADDPVELSASERAAIRASLAKNRLSFVGIHWLLAQPPGLHLTCADEETRLRSWRFMDGLVDLCADLNAERDAAAVMVLGSPKQRSTTPGVTPAQATERLQTGLQRIAAHAARRNVEILLEPLSPDQTDVVTSLDEAVAIVRDIGSPAIRSMFDVHNAVKEESSHTDLLRANFEHIAHVHVNEFDGTEPGYRNYPFPALLAALRAMGYSRWVSVEAFDFSRPAEEVAQRALSTLLEASNAKEFSTAS